MPTEGGGRDGCDDRRVYVNVGALTACAGSEPLRASLEAIRTNVLARAERRFRGLTATERDLLESTTVELVDELVRALDPFAARPSGRDKGEE